MAALTTPHWEALTPGARDLLTFLGQLPSLRPFYLAGGTALALRLGHRISQDLDLFANIETLDDRPIPGSTRPGSARSRCTPPWAPEIAHSKR